MTPSFAEATRAWVRVALQSFGGPAGQIAVLHRVLVDEKGWLSEEQFAHALGYCMLLPGPEAQQLATYGGWLFHGVRGGLVAGSLFVLPGFVAILGLSILYVTLGHVAAVGAVFAGLKPAVVAIVVEALLRLRRRAVPGRRGLVIAGAAFAGIFFLGIPFPAIVAAAALAGVLLGRRDFIPPSDDRRTAPGAAPSLRRLGGTVAVWLAIWLVPVAVLIGALGREHILAREAVFFSRVAVVTFGGAYAVLGYVAQQAVDVFRWLTPGEMLDGLGLAETTPGPLIMVVQFVGFLAAWREPGAMSPLTAGVIGSVVTTWVTFAPCFLFIFAGAPYIEWLRGNRRLQAAMGGIMAAVVGVVLNLAVWFALHTLFGRISTVEVGPVRLLVPSMSTLSPVSLAIVIGALVAALRFRAGMFAVLGGGGAAGVLAWLLS